MDDLTIDEKKQFIYDNIEIIDDTNPIIKFVIDNNINYSKNINGIHVNITILNDEIINIFYDLIYSLINNKKQEEKFLSEYNNAVDIISQKVFKSDKKLNEIKYNPLKLTELQKDFIKSIK